MSQLENIINAAFENRADISPANVSAEVRSAVEEAINLLDSGKARVAEKTSGAWVVNQWLKKAVLLSFRINENRVIEGGNSRYYDKVEAKFSTYSPDDFAKSGVRVVPNAIVRHGAGADRAIVPAQGLEQTLRAIGPGAVGVPHVHGVSLVGRQWVPVVHVENRRGC